MHERLTSTRLAFLARPSVESAVMALCFPDPSLAQPDGLLAMGGNLHVETLLNAYRHGIFPWTEQPITWWTPDPRGIIEWENFHLSRRSQRKQRQGHFQFTIDQDFSAVIRACARADESPEEVWIGPRMIAAYEEMHRAGYAHSVECWQHGELVGGIYGVAVGGFFAGESMFSRVSDASKLSLAFLMNHLQQRDFVLFDTQMTTEHTCSLGATEIPRAEYLHRLRQAIDLNCSFLP